MRMTAFIFLITCLHVSAVGYSQKVSLSVKNKPLQQVFAEIISQTGVSIIYNENSLSRTSPISINVKNVQLQQVLDMCVRDQPIMYTINGNNIVIKTRPVKVTGMLTEAIVAVVDTITVSGKVTDEKGAPVPGATVMVKGARQGASTNSYGEFVLKNIPQAAVITVSSIGYVPREIDIAGRATVTVTLKEYVGRLSETVVVGYGTVKKSDLTGSVARIGEDDIKATPVTGLDRAMQGRAAGVLVTQNSARPGGGSTIRIRGTGSVNAGNDPLYVVDGFPTHDINEINPADIESIEILKDASSTAIYGSRGSNGVVMVTTKRGRKGESSINFESYYGVQSVRRKIPLLNAQQYAEFINEARINGGGAAYFDGSSATQPLPASLGKGTDWQDEVFQNAPLQSYQLSISGGEAKTRYAISGNIYDQQGIIANSNFKRYTLRANLDREVTSRLNVGLSMQGAYTKSNAARTETDGGASSGVTNAAINYAPTFPVFNANGKYYRDQGPLNGNLVDNPLGLANEITDQFSVTRLLSNFFAEYKIIDGLTFRTSWGADLFNTKSNYYVTRQIGLGAGTNGDASVSASESINWLNENTLTYNRVFAKDHNVTALIGYTSQGYHQENVTANATNFNDDFALFNNLAAGATLRTPGSGAGDWALASYLARINYGYADRFLLTLTARRDGSSRFGPNKKYGFFPSGAFAWRVINEQFMKQQNVFSDLKFRASYGLTGNQEIGDYGYLSFISNVKYPFGSTPVLQVGGVPGGISNHDLSWEKNAQLDAGIDVGFLNNRIQLTADYYIKTTSDLLFSVNVPQTTGYSSSLQNIGQVENRGLELGLNTINIEGHALQWNSAFTISFNRNKVLNLDGRPEFTAGSGSGHLGVWGSTILMKVGEPLGNFYGRKVTGIFQDKAEIDASAQKNASPGDLRYADLNDDGVINDLDRTVIGNGNPKFFGGLNNTFTYKGVELNLFFQGSYGNDILNFGRFDLYNLNGNNNQSADVLDRWTASNPSKTIPRANAAGGQRILSSFHIEDGSYLRLKNISLGYHLPSSLLKKLSLADVKIYASAQNWFTITNYKGYDPEVSRFGSSSIDQGMDYGGYPTSKSVLVGLNVKF
ncbi:TonB-dependent receptor [Chitinophaga sp. MM2321]|uniref:TonB-dependent receptor n=1 Tax=Chitinophaga sp. MM2321 TaxID=3137178 RepID=UPI0032D5A3BF